MELRTINSLNGLASILGCTTNQLVYYVYRRPLETQYQTFFVKKKSGGRREISAPNTNLKLIQKKISTELGKLRDFSPCVNGFVKDRDIHSNARFHIARKFLLNIDLEDFFGSVNFGRVYGMLTKAPYNINPKIAACIAKACTFNDKLPQGAPSSPVITNLICAKMDSQLLRMAKRFQARYTRYADDISFSTQRSSLEPIAYLRYVELEGKLVSSCEVGSALRSVIEENGFRINDLKSRLFGKAGRQEVTGLVVNSRPNVKRRYVRQIRAMLHAWDKFGLEDAQSEFNSIYSYSQYEKDFEEVIRGKISFVKHVKGGSDRVFINLATKFNEISKGRQIRIELSTKEIAQLATWVVETQNNQGTACNVEGHGFVTCLHCLGGTPPVVPSAVIYHASNPGKKYNVVVRDFDVGRDLARLDIENLSLGEITPISLSKKLVKEIQASEERISLMGYPNHGPGKSIRVEMGTVVREYPKSGVQYVEITPKIVAGNSGGPVFDETFKLIGIATHGVSVNTPLADAEFLAIQATELTLAFDP